MVTACSTFNPMPSLASRLVNAYKMKDDVLTIHLVGGARGARVVREGRTHA